MPAATTAIPPIRPGVIAACPSSAPAASVVTGSTPEKSPARSTPSRSIAAYQATNPPVVTTAAM
jgi:hypothetical protein